MLALGTCVHIGEQDELGYVLGHDVDGANYTVFDTRHITILICDRQRLRPAPVLLHTMAGFRTALEFESDVSDGPPLPSQLLSLGALGHMTRASLEFVMRRCLHAGFVPVVRTIESWSGRRRATVGFDLVVMAGGGGDARVCVDRGRLIDLHTNDALKRLNAAYQESGIGMAVAEPRRFEAHETRDIAADALALRCGVRDGLMAHQAEAVRWMVRHERQPFAAAHSVWVLLDGECGTRFAPCFNGFAGPRAFVDVRGGLLAHDPRLGGRLEQMFAVIGADTDTAVEVAGGRTLVIAPTPAAARQWSRVGDRVAAGGYRDCLVLTTRSTSSRVRTLSSPHSRLVVATMGFLRQTRGAMHLQSVKWHRLIVDCGGATLGLSEERVDALATVAATCKWVLAPVAQPHVPLLVRLLRVPGLDSITANGPALALLAHFAVLQHAPASQSPVRRSSVTTRVSFGTESQQTYDALLAQCRALQLVSLSPGRALRQSIDRLRAHCSLAEAGAGTGTGTGVARTEHKSLTGEFVCDSRGLMRTMSASELFCVRGTECAICRGNVQQPTLTECSHAFCRDCILRWVLGGHRSCPLCRHAIESLDSLKAFLEPLLPPPSECGPTDKIQVLGATLALAPPGPLIVLTEFKQTAKAVSLECRARSVPCVVVVGKSGAQRREAMRRFGGATGPGPAVLVIAGNASADDASLPRVARVVVMEPSLNVATQTALIDRLLLPDRDTSVEFLVMRDSIEDTLQTSTHPSHWLLA